jgi:cytochrome c-type biogenesis protein CcmF
VGFPWFNSMFVTFMPLMVLLMGIGPLARWKQQEPAPLLRRLRVAFAISAATGLAVGLPFLGDSWSVGLAAALSLWLLATLLMGLGQRLRTKGGVAHLFQDFAGRGGRSFLFSGSPW